MLRKQLILLRFTFMNKNGRNCIFNYSTANYTITTVHIIFTRIFQKNNREKILNIRQRQALV